MALATSPSPAFHSLKAEIEGYPRICGYYLVDMVSIQELRDRDTAPEELLESVFSHFDDQEWPPFDQRPTDQTWADYEADPVLARDVAIGSLVGGSQVGHTTDTIPYETAAALWERFLTLFPEPRKIYVGMGFGDPKYVFQQGAAVVSSAVAGLVWVVESD